MSTQKKTDKSNMIASILEKVTLSRLLKVLSETFIISFFVSELVFLYLLSGGISRFPENMVVCLVFLTIVLVLELIFFPIEVVLLTSTTSVVTIIAIVNFLFGSSTNPHIFPFSDSAQADVLLGLFGGFVWVILLDSVFSLLKSREITKRHALTFLSAAGVIVLVFLLYSYSTSIVTFFDEHPWFVTFLCVTISAVVAYTAGRKRK